MTLAAAEISLAESLEFSPQVCVLLQEVSQRPLERLVITESIDDEWVQRHGDGISVMLKREGAERFVHDQQHQLLKQGYLVFASSRLDLRGCGAGDELILLKTSDLYEMIRVRNTYAYELTNDEIINQLKSWDELCGIRLLGAGPDWISMEFLSLPENLLPFALSVYRFCSEGIGEFEEVDEEGEPLWFDKVDAQFPERIEEAFHGPRAEEGLEYATYDEKCAKLVAGGLAANQSIFFWWD
ncbi:hypothetical protein CCAX7_47450 [Capsulimonas corticalis]|uniref:Uncharacterized protein n=1 Tax=Capsulimonas corticalis TaxID=2219043 RepID=A0A402CQI7_9BACT|nr:DUF4253 domain-containing protein [Capsulimonas corticalis]BDI32694.1 hypothetical protein CCAX7_47450 [Capsulimonas corticalis]